MARAAHMTKEERSESARKAAEARWADREQPPADPTNVVPGASGEMERAK